MRTVILAFLGLFTASALAQPSAPAAQPAAQPSAPAAPPGYRLEAGPFKPAMKELKLGELPIRVRYPRGATAPVPLVIFSHGMGGSFDAFAEVTAHWVSHGYVVILPTHADSTRRQGRDGRAALLRDAEAYRRRVDPVARVNDVKLILRSLENIELETPELKLADGRPLIDRERVGIAGHSAGALTTQMAIGAKVRTRDSLRPHSVGDDRFDAAIVISGQGTTNRMFTEDSWSTLDKPMLVITGSKDTAGVGAETPESRRHPYEFAPAGDKFLLWIEGATHSSYQGPGRGADIGRRLDREEPGTPLKVIGDAVMAQTLAFWDAYLKHDEAAAAYLREDRVRAVDEGVKPEHK
ncbi:MAG: alpha/beta hydrolase family protein [Phycisphaerales bacterium]